MTVLDVIILIIFIVAAVLGFRKGFIVQVGSLAAIVIGIIACRLFGHQVTEFITPAGDATDSATGSDALTYFYTILVYCGIYIVAYYAVVLVAKVLKLITHTILLGPLDRIGGAIVSVVKWFIPVSLLLNLYMAIDPDCDLTEKMTLASGQPVQWIADLAPAILGIIQKSV